MNGKPEADPGGLRTFLALPLHDYFAAELRDTVEALRPVTEGMRWLEPAAIHITLHFFGPTMPEEVQTIRSAVTAVTDASAPLLIALRGLGFFPDAHRPKVLWAGVADDGNALVLLREALEKQISRAGFPVETKPFRAHATIARIRDPHRFRLRRELPSGFPHTGTRTIDHLVLFQSHLSPEGARYEALDVYPLSKGAFTRAV